MTNKVNAAATDEEKDRECRHHWIIEAPAGPVSIGVCKHCGEIREFQNYWRGSSWERDLPPVLEIPVGLDMSSDDGNGK